MRRETDGSRNTEKDDAHDVYFTQAPRAWFR